MEASDIERGEGTKAASFDQGLTVTGPFNVLLLGEFGFFGHHNPSVLIAFVLTSPPFSFVLSCLSLSFFLSAGRAGKTSLAERAQVMVVRTN